MGIIINLLATAIISYLLATFLKGVHFIDFGSAIIFSAVLGVLNTILKPILKILTFPINMLSFGMFSIIINFAIVYIANYYFVEGLVFDNIGWILLFSMCISISNSILSIFK